MLQKKMHKSFTLIEMLIVIVIIGILAAALVPRLQAVQNRARDTKRKADLSQVFTALMIYYEDNSSFPLPRDSVRDCSQMITGNAPCHASSFNNSTTTGWISQLSTYMTSLPVDPLNTLASNMANRGPWYDGNYAYAYITSFGRNGMSLFAGLENTTDSDRCELQGNRMYVNTFSSTTYVCSTFYSSVSPSNSNTGSILKMYVRSHPTP